MNLGQLCPSLAHSCLKIYLERTVPFRVRVEELLTPIFALSHCKPAS